MSAIKDIQLKGNNLCNVECQDKNGIVHPKTCVDQVLTTHTGSVTLSDWLTYSGTETPLDGFDSYNGLIPWLQHYYPINGYTLPTATYNNAESAHIGGIMVNPAYLTLQSGVLSIKVASLHIPSEVETTSYTTEGKIALGNDTTLPINFVNGDAGDTSATVNVYPLRLDANNHAGIAVPKSDFSAQVQSNWNQDNDSAVDYIKNKPTIPTVNNSTITFKQDNTTKGTITLNQSSSATITFDTPVASNSTLGCIKTNYVETDENKPVKVDANGNAYVNVQKSISGYVSNATSVHYIMPSGASSAGCYPIMKIAKTPGIQEDFKVNQHFAIMCRHSYHFYGEWYINFKNAGQLDGAIMLLNHLSEKDSYDRYILDPSDLIVAATNTDEITVYLNVRNLKAESGGTPRCSILIEILGSNNADINTITYYTTSDTPGDNEAHIDDDDPIDVSTITFDQRFKDIPYINRQISQ